VPYGGGAPVVNAVIANQVPVAILMSAGPAVQMAQAGRVRAIVTTGARRSPALPDVPTTKEGGLPEYQVSAWNAVFAPRGTPPEILKKLSDALVKAVEDPGTSKRLLDLGGDLSNKAARTPDGLGKLVESEVARWSKVLKAAAPPAK